MVVDLIQKLICQSLLNMNLSCVGPEKFQRTQRWERIYTYPHIPFVSALLWGHNRRDGASSHQHHDCLLNHSFRRRSKKTSKLCVTGLCAGNSPVTGNAENVSFDDVIMSAVGDICDIGKICRPVLIFHIFEIEITGFSYITNTYICGTNLIISLWKM